MTSLKFVHQQQVKIFSGKKSGVLQLRAVLVGQKFPRASAECSELRKRFPTVSKLTVL